MDLLYIYMYDIRNTLWDFETTGDFKKNTQVIVLLRNFVESLLRYDIFAIISIEGEAFG